MPEHNFQSPSLSFDATEHRLTIIKIEKYEMCKQMCVPLVIPHRGQDQEAGGQGARDWEVVVATVVVGGVTRLQRRRPCMRTPLSRAAPV